MYQSIARLLIGALVLALSAGGAQAQDTPTTTPTVTPTSTPTFTATNTPTLTPTHTPNTTLAKIGKPFNVETKRLLEGFSPAAKQLGLYDLLSLSVRQVRVPATDETALGLSDVGTVTSILAFDASSQDPASKGLLLQGVDYSVSGRDVIPIGDHSGEIWIITYRPE